MGFWSGFAQGWEAESERIERRKLFQQEQNEKRMGVLAELVSKGYGRAAQGLPGAGEGDATPASKDHYVTSLGRYGMTPEQVAKIDSEGGVYGLKAAVDLLEENKENLTPELLNRIPDAIVVTPRESTGYDIRALSDNIFGPDYFASLDPADQTILEMQAEAASGAQTPYVTTVLPTPKPVNSEVINGTIKAANDTLMVELAARKEAADQAAASLPDGDEKNAAIAEASRMEALIGEVQAGSPLGAIREVGGDIIGPYLENNPMLKQNPALLGPWKFAAENYLTGGMAGGAREYTSAAEVQADIDAGVLKEGDVVVINGQEIPIRFGD